MKNLNKIFSLFMGSLALIFIAGCNDKKQEPVRPFTLMTELNKDVNQIKTIFGLPNNSLVITSNKEYGVYLFNNQLLPLKQYTFKVRTEIAGPFMLDDEHFGIIAGDVTNGSIDVYMFDFDLNMIKKRRINHLFLNVPFTIQYYSFAARSPDGNIVLANTNAKETGAKISVVSIKNIMEDNVRAWSWIASDWSGDWLHNMHIGKDGSVYLAGYPNPGSENFVIKINDGGTFGFRKAFPYVQTGAHLYTDENRLIYHDNVYFYDMDLNGELQQKVHIQDNEWFRVSNLISSGSDFYFYKDTITPDGAFAALYKLDNQLQVKKVRLMGNQGTNTGFYENRNLLKMPNGEMIFSALVENPDLSGNHWFLTKFDDELRIEGEE